MLTQEELVQRAFATQSALEVDEEFAKEKALVEGDEDPTRKLKKEKDMGTASGWGSWAGQGAPPANMHSRKLPKKLQTPETKVVKRPRVDAKKPNVIISAKRVKKMADQYMLSTIPYPYTSREEYERSMAGGVGRSRVECNGQPQGHDAGGENDPATLPESQAQASAGQILAVHGMENRYLMPSLCAPSRPIFECKI
ncbi:hypothetical protein [Janthinobacterium sp.]|uniref:hypothetical protein n=1 Tax=Janthinobacterium sp. TaxID=1871054 RepID=UPI00293D4F45|nr:hypothetical protein [Janthinobacterium sp.]